MNEDKTIQFLYDHWYVLAILIFYLIDKLVQWTPCKWDDFLVTGVKKIFFTVIGKNSKK